MKIQNILEKSCKKGEKLKNKIISFVVMISFLIICATGWIEKLFDPLIWLVKLNITTSNISKSWEWIVGIITWVASYVLVGAIFTCLGWWNSKVMKIAYFVVSTVISFVLCYLVMLFEMWIVIAVGTILFLSLIIWLTMWIKNRKDINKENVL